MELNKAQKEAIEHPKGPLLIVAGAGSGKTKTLTERMLRLIARGIEAHRLVAITFTNKAAKEMRERLLGRLRGGEPFIGTFHSFGARILKAHASELQRTPNFSIFDDNDSLSLIKAILKSMNLPRGSIKPIAARAEISRLKSELKSPETLYDAVLEEIFYSYERALERCNAFDFDDLLQKVAYLFGHYPSVLEEYRAAYHHILIDEFQDVNAAQYRLVALLAAEHRNVSAVGDDAQSIYKFRGSDFRNFLNFEHEWPDAKVITLDQNYRSTQTILSAASAVIAHNKMQKPKRLWTENSAGNPIAVTKASSAEEEADTVAAIIAKQIADAKAPISTGILYRTNAQSRAIEQALIAHNIQYQIFGGLRFYERKEIKDILSALRFIHNNADEASVDRLRKTFGVRLSRVVLESLRGLKPTTDIPTLIANFLSAAHYFEFLAEHFENVEDRRDNIIELIGFAGGFTSLTTFLEQAALMQSSDGDLRGKKNRDLRSKPIGIHLMTMHLSKGLEFDTVFIVGASEGLLPHARSLSDFEELEEERRVMYVAMTRARRELYISFTNLPSRFLFEIPGNLTVFSDLTGHATDLEDDAIYLEE